MARRCSQLRPLPILGAAGMAVDYSRADNVRAFLQGHADNAALEAMQLGAAATKRVSSNISRARPNSRFGRRLARWTSRSRRTGTARIAWRCACTRVRAGDHSRGRARHFRESVPVSVAATARDLGTALVYTAPEVSELDYEAGDYNRVSVYCFDYQKFKATGDRAGRARRRSRSPTITTAPPSPSICRAALPAR